MTPPKSPSTAVTGTIISLATALYGVGLFTPMATIQTKFLPFIDRSTSYSLVRTIRNIFTDGDHVLGVVLVLFTFVFPVTKLFSLFMGLWGGWRPHNSRLYRWMRATGHWSMLDVFVVAILVVFLRVQTMGGGMSMAPEMGIYCFGASVLLAIWAGQRIDRTAWVANTQAEGPMPDDALESVDPDALSDAHATDAGDGHGTRGGRARREPA